MKKIALGCDHAAYEMKETVKRLLLSQNFDVIDVGTHSAESVDYPDYAKKVSHEVITGNIQGILLCGSGIGVSMAANRYKGIRAALCRSTRDAEMSRRHNNANVLCIGARFNTEEEIISIIKTWFESSFEGGRHAERLNQFSDLGENC